PESADLPLRYLEPLLDDRHTWAEDVLFAPVVKRLMRGAADSSDQIAPRGAAIRVRPEERLHTGAKRRVANQVVQLLQNTRRFVVDDCAVIALRLIEIRDRKSVV